uniref:Uncharacterized protein n=1 Tax=Chenopodium quinoa TaxID=63459 RepID=A0A803M9Y8_CHEQI
MIHSATSRPKRGVDQPARSVSKIPKRPSSPRPRRLGIVKNITPFSQEIMNTPIPPKVKIPTLDPYDGKTDPTDHLNAYKAQMGVQTGSLLFGLKSNKLKFELVHDKVSTFSEAMERAEWIIEASEVCKAPVANNKGKRKQEDNYHDNRNRRSRRAESDDEGLKYNADRREIYLDIKHKAILPKPNPMNTPIEQRNKKLWLHLHHNDALGAIRANARRSTSI